MYRIEVSLFENQRLIQQTAVNGVVLGGRQGDGEPEPVTMTPFHGRIRLIVADKERVSIPQYFFEVSAGKNAELTIRNLDHHQPLRVGNAQSLDALSHRAVGTEVGIDLDDRLRLFARLLDSDMQSAAVVDSARPQQQPGSLMADTRALIRRLEAASKQELQQVAVQLASEVGELDRAMLLCPSVEPSLIRTSEVTWRPILEHPDPSQVRRQIPIPSSTLLNRVLTQKTPQWFDPEKSPRLKSESLEWIHYAVAAPIINADQNVVAVIYCDRWNESDSGDRLSIGEHEMHLIAAIAEFLSSRMANER